ncbi:RING finger domain protein [Diplocarpon rosae]|nr:RING finger domain protein [Diplocarpon rosae]
MPSILFGLREISLPFFTKSAPLITTICKTAKLSAKPSQARAFTSTPALLKKDDRKKKIDPRITLIRYHLQHAETPRPLRLSRMRALRHWTIHRAWMLTRRKKAEREEGELMRMYQSIHRACEELRTMDAPGTKDAGRLYRIAMEKKGIFKQGGVPIEYARFQTDTPGKEVWNHEWTR